MALNREWARWPLVYCLLSWVVFAPPLRAEEVVAAAARSDAVHQPMSVATLQAIFGMRLRNWGDGSPIKVFVLPDNHPLHVAFCKQVLHVYPHQLRAAWDRLVFSGTGQAPIEVDSKEAMLAKLSTTPGAIGYLVKPMVNDRIAVVPVE